MMNTRTIFGIDFTSAPRRAKAITVARGALTNDVLVVEGVSQLTSFEAFEAFLDTPGPWVGGFDFPFGLPEALVRQLNWPSQWRDLVLHVQQLGKPAFKEALDGVRISRPVGAKYIERRGDRAAGASSPMKLVNPPVGLMFFEGAVRLALARLCVVPCDLGDFSESRVALEAYPGYLARQITRLSYKKDGREGNTAARVQVRREMVAALATFVRSKYGLQLGVEASLSETCVADGSGDTLDAVLCCIQAAVATKMHNDGDTRFGIPAHASELEGWIATVP